MGILTSSTPAIVICTRDLKRATAFYCDTLGLEFLQQDKFASVFSVGGVMLRVSTVAVFTPHEHTILGFRVPDVEAAVQALRDAGVAFNRYPHFPQNDLGILTLPGGAVQVAWFQDPDGNVLSVSDV